MSETDRRERWAKAQKVLERLPGAGTLAKAVASLARDGAADDECRQFADSMTRLFGLGLDAGEIDRAVRRGLAAVRPAEPAAAAPAPAVTAAPAEVEFPELPEESPMPAMPPAFTSAQELIALAANPKQAKELLSRIEKATAELGRRAEVDAGRRTVFFRRVDRARAALAEQQAALQKQRDDLRQGWHQLAEERKRDAALREDGERWRGIERGRRYQEFPGGMVRDFGPSA
jgi:hypothetical protein